MSDEQDYKDYQDYLEYQKHIGSAPEGRKANFAEGAVRGFAEGVIPGTDRRNMAMRHAMNTGNHEGYAALAKPEVVDDVYSNARMGDAVQGSESMPKDDLGPFAPAARSVGSLLGVPARLAGVASKLIPSGSGRVLTALSDIGKGVAGNLTATTAEKVASQGELPTAGETAVSAGIGAGIPLVGHMAQNAADGAKFIAKEGGRKLSNMTESGAETYSKNPDLVHKLAYERASDNQAFVDRGARLGKDAVSAADKKIADLVGQRAEARAGKRISVDPEQYKGTAIEPEMKRLSLAAPGAQKTVQPDAEVVDAFGNPLKTPMNDFTPPGRVSVAVPRAGDYVTEMGDAAGFKQQYVPIEQEARNAANRVGNRNMRRAIEAVVPEEAGLNVQIAKNTRDSKTLARALGSDPSKIITSNSPKMGALAQSLNPEAREAQEAYQASKQLHSEHDNWYSNIPKAVGRKMLSVAGPKTPATGGKPMPNLQEILAGLRAATKGDQ